MKAIIITTNRIEAICRKSPSKNPLDMMAERHPFTLTVECEFDADKFDWSLHTIYMQNQVEAYFRDTYGMPAEIGTRTYEQIASDLMNFYPTCIGVTVKDETLSGAKVFKRRGGFHARR